jgi:tRNA modification GTPase
MTSPAASSTYLACLTPPGRGAIATLALRGPDAWQLMRALFLPRGGRQGLPPEPERGRFWLGRLGETSPGGMDDVVLAVTRTEPVPWLEVHCHGGMEVIRLLEEVFAARGVQVCGWQDMQRRTAEDAGEATALAALADASTVRTAAILLDQYHGAFARGLEAARAAVQRNDPAEATHLLDDLARHAPVGRHLTVPWRVVIAGAPNVGKSSLVNALAGYSRSVVAPTPGTTRDVVTVAVAIDGWPVELADTAGWRDAGESLEQQGIDRARSAAAHADLCLWVLDAAAEPVWPAEPVGRVHYVLNKTDLAPAWDLTRAADAVWVSARTGAGLDELCQALSRALVPHPPPAGAAVPFTRLLAEQVEAARLAWHEGRGPETLRRLENLWEERR